MDVGFTVVNPDPVTVPRTKLTVPAARPKPAGPDSQALASAMNASRASRYFIFHSLRFARAGGETPSEMLGPRGPPVKPA